MGSVFKSVLPLAATAAGAYFGGPAIAAATGLSAGTGSIIGGALGNMAGSAISGGGSTPSTPAASPPAPAIPATVAMPTASPDSQAVALSQQRSIASQLARRGRASTILTDSGGGNTLGS